jgi:hypothetical protein
MAANGLREQSGMEGTVLYCRRPRVSAPLVVMPRGVESLGSLLAGSVSAQESSFQVRAATHTMAMVVATSMTEKYR